MKQQIIELKKKLLLVEKEGDKISQEFIDILNEHSIAEIVGKLTDITEEQFEEMVDKYNYGPYRDYNDSYPFYPDGDVEYFFLTAKESFFSKLEADGIYFFKEPEAEELNPYSPTAKWIDALEIKKKVWNRNNTFLFEIYE